ncbi:MAG: MASE1 domain-containing protein, partial [Bdellovibrionales bacterium]|nr:MASE1 domain-containing protein [Bdellovibrionales bacterium]
MKNLSRYTLMALSVAMYLALAKLGLLLAFEHASVSPVWPPTGFAISLLLLTQGKFWPAIAVGAFLANFSSNSPLGATTCIAIGNTLEAVIGYVIISKNRTSDAYDHLYFRSILFILGSVVASFTSAIIGVSSLALFGSISKSQFVGLFGTWLTGDLLGALIITPLFAFDTPSWQKNFREIRRVTSLGSIGLILVSLGGIFIAPEGTHFPLLLFPVLLVVASVGGPYTMRLSVVLIAVCSVLATINDMGPFASGVVAHDLMYLQLFMLGVSLTSIAILSFKSIKELTAASIVLLVGWFFSGVLYYTFTEQDAAFDEQHYSALIHEVEDRIVDRMRLYVDYLISGASLFAASESVEPDEWRAFVDYSELV